MYKFIEVKDYGATCCPHCGADGRYIYVWEQDGVKNSAMAGCFNKLTSKISKGSTERFLENLFKKQASGKNLNGWQKTVLRMLEYKKNNQSDTGKISWADGKINEAISQSLAYQKRF